jgi:large subunit ribosomal protein L9e
VDINVRSRVVTVKGDRGTLVRDFSHMSIDMSVLGGKKKRVELSSYFATRKDLATLRTAASHIENMITGVTKGFIYKMRLVYAHFPINASVVDDGKMLEIRNFLGEKIVRRIPMLDGVTITRSTDVKDELVLTGNDIEMVSQSAAQVQQRHLVKNKDIRKFLDGVYVSHKGVIETED